MVSLYQRREQLIQTALQKYFCRLRSTLVDAYDFPVAVSKSMETDRNKRICMKHTVDRFCEVANTVKLYFWSLTSSYSLTNLASEDTMKKIECYKLYKFIKFLWAKADYLDN